MELETGVVPLESEEVDEPELKASKKEDAPSDPAGLEDLVSSIDDDEGWDD